MSEIDYNLTVNGETGDLIVTVSDTMVTLTNPFNGDQTTGYVITSISGEFNGETITGEYGSEGAIGYSAAGRYDNTYFDTSSDGLFGSVDGIDNYGIAFQSDDDIYTLTGLNGTDLAYGDENFEGGYITVNSVTPVACYLAGTRILTARGEIAVEDLRVDDVVPTFTGTAATQPIRWIGRTRFDAGRHPAPEKVWPVRIRAGALGEGLPVRDLLVSPDHAIMLEGRLIPAKCLLNGISIVRDRTIGRGTYFHVELDRHDVILAEGLPAETYLDTGNRDSFENAGMFRRLHPDFTPKTWRDTCLPLLMGGPALDAIRATLAARSGALPAEASTAEAA
jgi:hypothetical protein